MQRLPSRPHPLRTVVMVVTAASLLAAAGCGSGHAEKTTRGHRATATASATPTASAKTPPSTGPSLTGFGATVWEWNNNHVEVPGYNPGAVYDEDPTLPRDGGGRPGNRYVLVSPSDGRITMYQLNFPLNTGTDTALAKVRAEFPPDVAVVWQQQKDTCYQVEFKSVTLGLALADPKIGDPQGTVLASLASPDIDGTGRYLTGQVSYTLLMVFDAVRPEDAPSC